MMMMMMMMMMLVVVMGMKATLGMIIDFNIGKC
jgi:hypothetical protein